MLTGPKRHQHPAALSYQDEFETVGRQDMQMSAPIMMSFLLAILQGPRWQSKRRRRLRAFARRGRRLAGGSGVCPLAWPSGQRVAHQSAVGGAAGLQGDGALVPPARRPPASQAGGGARLAGRGGCVAGQIEKKVILKNALLQITIFFK